MAKIGTLFAELGIDSAKFKSGLDKAVKDLNSFQAQANKTMRSIQQGANLVKFAIAAWAGSQVVGAIMKVVQAFASAEGATVKLNSALQATGRFSEAAVSAIQDSASAISKLTKFDDDDIVAATATFAQFAKSLNGPELASAQKGIVGLATVMKVDLDTAAKQLGKTVMGSSDTIGRSGITISKTKDQSERLSEAISKLNSMYQQAQGEAESLEGRSAQINVAWGNLQETLGGLVSKILGGTDALASFRDMIINVDNFLKQHQKTIIQITQFIVQMGETTLQIGKVVFNGIGMIVNAVGFGITGTVANALKMIQLLANGAINSLNSVLTLAHNITGMKVQLLSQASVPGLDLMNNLKGQFGKDFFNTAEKAGKGISDIFSGKSNVRLGLGNKLGHALQVSGLDSGSGNSGGSKKNKKAGKSEAEKEMERLKDAAKQLKESVKDIWTKEAEAIALADKLLKLHLITQIEYTKAVNNAKNTAHEAFKIDGLKEAFEKFQQPMEDFKKNFSTSLSDALDDPAFQAVQKTIEDTLTPLEKYNQQVEYLNYLHDSAGLSTETWTRALKAAKDDLDNTSKSANGFAQAIGNVVSQFGDKFFDTVTNSLKGTKTAFKDFVASALEDLAKLIFKMTVTIPIANALTSALGGKAGGKNAALSTGGNILSGIITGLLTDGKSVGHAQPLGPAFSINGAMAEGGSFMPGNYLVGEKGPEIVSFGRPGFVTPNNQIGAGQTVQITNVFNISTGVQQTVRAEISAMMPSIEKRTRDGVMNAINRGGSAAAVVGRKA